MTKRFTITNDFEEHHRQIRDNGKIIMGCFIEAQAEPIVKLLNELNDENEQLKKRNKFLEEFDGRAKTVANLKEEIERLKEDNKSLRLGLINASFGM